MFIPVILGTARQGRNSENPARFILEETKKTGVETELIDVRDFINQPATDNTEKSDCAQRFREKIIRADGYIIVSPEYNHGYPGELKMMLDELYKEYARKPVGICGVSIGPIGGARMVEQLRLVSIEFHMVPIREAIYFPTVGNLFNEKGEMKDPAAYKDRLAKFFDELLWYAQALKTARESK